MKPAFKTSLLKLALIGALFYTSYGLSNRYAASLNHVPEIAFAWERGIPFWAWTIVPYWSLNLMYAAAFFLCRDVREQNRYIARLVAAQIAATACFVLFPLRFGWPKPPAGGLSAWLFDSLAAFDLPYNQAPSLHIALAVIVGAFYWTRFPKIRLPLLLWQSLIALSVLTTYQHHFIDVPTGALLGWLVLWAIPQQGQPPLRTNLCEVATRGRIRRCKIALLYLAGAVLSALPALLGGAWLWTLWVSVSLLLVSAAYWSNNAAVFQKQTGGRLSAAATVLLLPYLAGVRLNMACWLRGKAKTARVRDDVWIGSVSGVAEISDGLAVLDVCAEYPCVRHHGGYRSLPLLDMVAPSENDLAQAARLLEEMRQRHGRVLACCALGYGRSAAVVLTWLTAYGGCRDLAQAAAELKQARPQMVLPPETAKVVEAAAGYLKNSCTDNKENPCSNTQGRT
ncbi:MAG: phosphatase PAP2/dual specificity phosphatase family protein [Neisseria sp.]|nr:phosphatase PAP2/dual specificity phosphatase family protein [Neisseria sp.]